MKKNNDYNIHPSIELKNYLSKNEKVLWYDRPLKKAYIIGASIKTAPVAILWLLIDCSVISFLFSSSKESFTAPFVFFLFFFFAFHLFPVWIWLYSIIKSNINHKYLEYCLTNKRLIIKNAESDLTYESIDLSNIQNVKLSFSLFDKQLKVGDLTITNSQLTTYKIFDCLKYNELFILLTNNKSSLIKNMKLNFCEYCGCQVKDGENTCSNCGAKL